LILRKISETAALPHTPYLYLKHLHLREEREMGGKGKERKRRER